MEYTIVKELYRFDIMYVFIGMIHRKQHSNLFIVKYFRKTSLLGDLISQALIQTNHLQLKSCRAVVYSECVLRVVYSIEFKITQFPTVDSLLLVI